MTNSDAFWLLYIMNFCCVAGSGHPPTLCYCSLLRLQCFTKRGILKSVWFDKNQLEYHKVASSRPHRALPSFNMLLWDFHTSVWQKKKLSFIQWMTGWLLYAIGWQLWPGFWFLEQNNTNWPVTSWIQLFFSVKLMCEYLIAT